MHGRPRALAGRYYSSLFIHYKPVDWALTLDDAIVRVPPHWLERGADVAFPRLAIRGTGFYEDECLDQWRALPTLSENEADRLLPPTHSSPCC